MKITLLVISSLLVIGIVVLAYYGLFAAVTIQKREIGPYALVYEKHIGPYKNTYKVMDRVYNRLLTEDQLSTTRGFGLYYDKPGSVPDEALRSIVGCILDGEASSQLESLSSRYKVVEFPASKGLVVEFPYKGALSVFLGIFRVYPKLSDFLAGEAYPNVPVMEVYDVPGQKIYYNVPVEIESELFAKYLE